MKLKERRFENKLHSSFPPYEKSQGKLPVPVMQMMPEQSPTCCLEHSGSQLGRESFCVCLQAFWSPLLVPLSCFWDWQFSLKSKQHCPIKVCLIQSPVEDSHIDIKFHSSNMKNNEGHLKKYMKLSWTTYSLKGTLKLVLSEFLKLFLQDGFFKKTYESLKHFIRLLLSMMSWYLPYNYSHLC